MPDFELARTEFETQCNVLLTLLKIVDASALKVPGTDDANRETLTVPPSGQNTMAAAAIVLLAAHFEEYVRQQIQEYAEHIVIQYDHLTEAQLEKFIDSYWRGGTGKLSRIRPKGDPLWLGSAESQLRSLIAFPVDKAIAKFSAALLSEHENNMRWDTITELASRVGVIKLSDAMFAFENLRTVVGVGSKGEFAAGLQRKINEFYSMRNNIVHSISQTSGIGSSVFSQWVNFFQLLAAAFADSLNDSAKRFDEDVLKRKARAAR